MSGNALLSLFEEIIKLTPGKNYPFHYIKVKLHPPLGSCPQGNRSPSFRNARVTPCPWGRQSWRTSDVGEQKCHPSSWVCGHGPASPWSRLRLALGRLLPCPVCFPHLLPVLSSALGNPTQVTPVCYRQERMGGGTGGLAMTRTSGGRLERHVCSRGAAGGGGAQRMVGVKDGDFALDMVSLRGRSLPAGTWTVGSTPSPGQSP